MLTIDQLKFPTKLRSIIADEGSYEDDSFSPILINVTTLGHKGRSVIGYQLILKAEAAFEDIEDLIYDAQLPINGQTWENLIRKYLKAQDPTFEKLVEGDTEALNCVLWTETEQNFRILLGYVRAFVENTDAAKQLL